VRVEPGEATSAERPESPVSAGRRWAARGALLAAAVALGLPLIVAGLKGVLLLLLGAVALGITAAGLWWALAHRGAGRIAGAVVAAVALAGAVAVYVDARFLAVLVASVALWVGAVAAARAALVTGAPAMPEYESAPPRSPYIIMNPRSGDGKVGRFDLVARARAAGARVELIDTEKLVDVRELARAAVAEGVDLLGVAGGDGTQALAASVAAEHGIPFLVLAAGTRNHFALDLGLDRDDPGSSLAALTDGVELLVDLGTVNGRPFVNNASFGAYAEVVRSPEYRAEKTQTILRELPDLLMGQKGTNLVAHAGGMTIEAPQALLVSNNPYGTGDPVGLGRRSRLDLGRLGVVGVRVDNPVQAAALVRGASADAVTVTTAEHLTVTADASEVPVGVDGEALVLRPPVRCQILPGALRVRVPRNRPGRVSRTKVDWHRVRQLAGVARSRAPRPPDRSVST
jgi:diacylglycerol kinase family enzyme